jgi:hypothetical protein
MGEDEIRRSFSLTEQDAVAANLLWARRYQLSRASLTFAGSAGLVMALIWLARAHRPWPEALAVAAGIAVGGALLIKLVSVIVNRAYIPFCARRAYREQAGLHRPVEIVATPDILTVSQQDFFARMPWSELPRWCEDKRALLLFTTRLTFYVLPRREFDEDEIARISAWLRAANVPRC